MKNLLTKLTFALLAITTSLSSTASADMNISSGIQGGIGYRQESLHWKIHDNDKSNPSAKSNLHFKDLQIVTLGLKYRGLLANTVYTRGSFDYGWIVDGNLREDLRIDHNESTNYSHHHASLNDGHYHKAVTYNKESGNSYVWDFDIGFGLPFVCLCEGLQIVPMVGFSYDRQHIKIRNRENVTVIASQSRIHLVANAESVSSPYKNNERKSLFRTSFWGPWLGFDLCYALDCGTIFSEFEVNFGRAERKRQTYTNVRSVDHYNHTKWYVGVTTKIGANFVISEEMYLEPSLGYSYRNSDEKHDSLYYSSGTARLDIGYMF